MRAKYWRGLLISIRIPHSSRNAFVSSSIRPLLGIEKRTSDLSIWHFPLSFH
jgi:hypothetical protein